MFNALPFRIKILFVVAWLFQSSLFWMFFNWGMYTLIYSNFGLIPTILAGLMNVTGYAENMFKEEKK